MGYAERGKKMQKDINITNAVAAIVKGFDQISEEEITKLLRGSSTRWENVSPGPIGCWLNDWFSDVVAELESNNALTEKIVRIVIDVFLKQARAQKFQFLMNGCDPHIRQSEEYAAECYIRSAHLMARLNLKEK